jgi:hypothetical protein
MCPLGNSCSGALVPFVAVLMVLNSIGVYGFLSHAHIEHAFAGDPTDADLGPVRYQDLI